jgi:DnaK suppressor protein
MAQQDVSVAVRQELEAERADLAARLDELEVSSDDALAYDDNFADSGQVAAEQGENHALASTIRDQLADIERALARLDEGNYGRCEQCGNPINPARLEAVPSARFCIEHA